LYLHSRQAALAVLQPPLDPAETAFQAFLDGNLPEFQASVPKIKNSMLRAFAEIELRDLQLNYEVAVGKKLPEFLAAQLERNPPWKALVTNRVNQEDRWYVQENLELKALLDSAFPIANFDLASKVRSAVALTREPDPDQLGLLAFDHIARVRASESFRKDCGLATRTCTRAAFLDLVESLAVSNAVRKLRRTGRVQSAGEAAEALAVTLSAKLEGQPDFSMERSSNLAAKINHDLDKSPAAVQRLRNDAISALYWEQGQSRVSFAALNRLEDKASAFPPPALLDAYYYDIPVRFYWKLPKTFPDPSALVPRAVEQIRQSHHDLTGAYLLTPFIGETDLSTLKREVSGRFHGHPWLARFLAWKAPAIYASAAVPQKDDADERLAILRQALKDRPDVWDTYSALGQLLIQEKGDYKEAARIFQEFPGFKDSRNYNPVELSNHAYEAGSWFFWRGEFEVAKKFYGISARLDTGSSATFASQIRLNILDGHYPEAARGSLVSATRYESAHAYRDYIGWLFAYGQREQGWAAFDELQNTLSDPQVWLAAHVGARLERRSWSDLKRWLLTDSIRNSGRVERNALTEAVMLNTMDRAPAADLVQAMKEIEGKPIASKGNGANTWVIHPQRGRIEIARSSLVTEAPALKSGDPVPSHLVLFADAYSDLRRGDFKSSTEKFFQIARYYPIEGTYVYSAASYALPYFAWASAKSGDPHKLEAYLDKRGALGASRFDLNLSKAFFTGLRGETDASLRYLHKAFDTRPYTNRRPIFTEYQWAEACEWLFEATGDKRYRDLALNWARVNQKTLPFHAWTYSMEAKLTSDEKARTRALGFALYLDPESERIARLPEAQKEAGRRWFAQHNPFQLDDKPRRTADAS
jgi:hypothetical protein